MQAKPHSTSGKWKRDPAKEAYWRKLVEQWGGSGQSIRCFCRDHGLSENLFYSWRREIVLRDRERQSKKTTFDKKCSSVIDKRAPRAAENFWEDQGHKPEPPASFVPLRVVDTATNSAEKDSAADCRLKIETPSGFLVSVEAGSVQFFAKVIRALEGTEC